MSFACLKSELYEQLVLLFWELVKEQRFVCKYYRSLSTLFADVGRQVTLSKKADYTLSRGYLGNSYDDVDAN